jgi:O-antigen ligase
MRSALRRLSEARQLPTVLVVCGLILAAALLGRKPDKRLLILLAALPGALLVLVRPAWGLVGLILAALIVPIQIGTGTEVTLNLATLLVPALATLWLFQGLWRRDLRWAASPANRPLTLFLLAGLLSLGIGNALWDPAVPRSDSFWLVQLAQWAIFAFSALAFWLMANLAREPNWLRRLTWTFLIVGGALALLKAIPPLAPVAQRLGTVALIRAPFWVLLTGLAGGQVLFNPELGHTQRTYLWLVLGAVLIYAFVIEREGVSNWVGVGAALAVLLWLRYPRLRWPALALLVFLFLVGLLFPTLFEFAGGEEEWQTSGASRLALIERVLKVTARNPVTGLGPAAYRPYTSLEPFGYGKALWLDPKISAHNNYVDLYAHTGLLGLGLLLWFMVRIAWKAARLECRAHPGFGQGYANGMLAVWAGMLVIMMLADWFLPFVYNIGFPGLQASVLVWLFMGGVPALEAPEDASGAVATSDGAADEVA